MLSEIKLIDMRKNYYDQNLDIPYLNLLLLKCFPSQKPYSFSGQKEF